MLYVWYPENRTDLNTIHKENDVIETGELAGVKAELKLLLGFWFGVGAALGAKMVNGLEELISR